MKIKARHVVIGAGVAIVVGAAIQLSKTAKRLVATPFFKAPRIPDFWRVVFPLDVQIKNPTAGGLKVNFPFVELMLGETVIGSSQAKREAIRIPGHSQQTIQDIEIEVPLLNLSAFATPLLDFVRRKTDSVELKVRVTSEADLKLTTIPINVVHPITISRNGGTV